MAVARTLLISSRFIKLIMWSKILNLKKNLLCCSLWAFPQDLKATCFHRIIKVHSTFLHLTLGLKTFFSDQLLGPGCLQFSMVLFSTSVGSPKSRLCELPSKLGNHRWCALCLLPTPQLTLLSLWAWAARSLPSWHIWSQSLWCGAGREPPGWPKEAVPTETQSFTPVSSVWRESRWSEGLPVGLPHPPPAHPVPCPFTLLWFHACAPPPPPPFEAPMEVASRDAPRDCLVLSTCCGLLEAGEGGWAVLGVWRTGWGVATGGTC